MKPLKLILIITGSLAGAAGLVGLALYLRKKSTSVTKEAIPAVSGTTTTVKPVKIAQSELPTYPDDTPMLFLRVRGIGTNIYKDKSATQLLRKALASEVIMGFVKADIYKASATKQDDYILMYANSSATGGKTYKKGYVQMNGVSAGDSSKTIKWSRMKEMLGI